MIHNEAEYQASVQRCAAEANRLTLEQNELKKTGLTLEEIKRATDPMRSFHEQLLEEVASYERLKRGEFDEIRNFHGIGQLLIALRIASGLNQRQLADELGVHESQVSRDERNEYRGITMERANRILEALNVELRSVVATFEHRTAQPVS